MTQNLNRYWDLMNNEIRRVNEDDAGRDIVVTTSFRSIQNKLYFRSVAWRQDIENLKGALVNYVEEVDENTATDEDMEALRDDYVSDFDFSTLRKAGMKLSRIACNKNSVKVHFMAKNMEILIND